MPSKKNDSKSWVEQTLKELNAGLYEREDILASALLTVLSGQSVFLYGPPGTAKSIISRRLSCVFSDSKYFEYLMQRFSTPEEIFGPIDISELKKNNYVRMTENYLPAADIAFLDEIWKSSPAILNTLLTIVNERKFRNGKVVEDVPLKALIAASNEFPQKNSGLDALYDRFIMRIHVGPMNNRGNFESMISDNLTPSTVKVTAPLSTQEWVSLMEKAHKISISPEVFSVINEIRKQVDAANASLETPIYISDRRWQKAMYILKMAALLSNRNEVIPVDLLILKNVLWSSEIDKPLINQIVTDSVTKTGVIDTQEAVRWKKDFDELEKEIKKTFKAPTDVRRTDYNYQPCLIGHGKVVKVEDHDYYHRRITRYVSYSPKAQGIIEDSVYYFPESDVTTPGGSGTAYTEARVSYPFTVISIDDVESTVSVNNQTIKVPFKSRPFVPKTTKETYSNAINNSMEDLSKIIQSMSDSIDKQKKGAETPFVPKEETNALFIFAINQIPEFEKNKKKADQLLKLIKKYGRSS